MPATRFPEASIHRSVLRRAHHGIGTRPLRALGAGLLLILVSAFSARAATFVVTTNADGNHGACTVSLCTLRDAVIAANAAPGSTITLPSNGSHYTLTLTGVDEDNAATGDLDVRANLTINGGGAATTIIDGNDTDRVFQLIGAVTLTLNDVTVTNGNTTSSSNKAGGGILTPPSSSSLVLNNSVVTGNNGVSGEGGGIFAFSVTLTNSTVSQNSTSNQGGGIFATSASVTNSSITNNHSTTDQGGGLFLINGASTITGSVVSGNTAGSGEDGGGIYLNGSINANAPALLTITNSTISGNNAADGGGIFILSFATVAISGSTISGNTSTSAGGAGIINDGALLTVINSTISGNTISAGSQGGGGIFNNGASAVATVTSTTISSNTAPSTSGGGILNNGGSVTLKNTIVANNTGGNCVGTIVNGGTNLQFPGTTCGGSITSADPLLQPLANNGGPTLTQALGGGSPAIDTGDSCPPPPNDQRGVSRPQGSACDIGAFECQTGECGGVGPTATPTPTSTPAGVATATPTNTPTSTPTAVAATPTRTATPIAGVVVPTLTFPMLALLGLALAGAALLLLKR